MMAGLRRVYELVVLGSTGFTGKFVAEEVQRLQGEGRRALKWAVAGRNEAKVRACLDASGIVGVDVLVADVGDQASLETLCAQTSVLINCVGPYQLYGEPVVKACISQKCSYVDITGEPYFMERMLSLYGDQAQEAGVYIVSACGFDCIPNDLGALLLQRRFQGELAYVDSYMATKGTGGFHTGTWESFLRSVQNHLKLKRLRRERGVKKPPLPSVKPPRRWFPYYSNTVRKWCLPVVEPDRSIVYRSQTYRHETEGISPFNFKVYFCFNYFLQALGVTLFLMLMLPLIYTNLGLRLLLKFPRFFSAGIASTTGPTKEQIEKSTFAITLEGAGYSSDSADRSKPPDSKIIVKVRGAEPGYVATSAMLVQSALCLLDEKDSLPSNGGIYTPAVAFGNTNLIKNLENTGKVKFEVVQN